MNIFMYDMKLSCQMKSSQVISHVVNLLPLEYTKNYSTERLNFLKNSSVLWDLTLCDLVKVNQHSEGMHYLHIQGLRLSQARNQRENRWEAELLFIGPED
jgi:hypothetical protein